jgi:predicted TIM-barrel fold metal-dependent hydrolase
MLRRDFLDLSAKLAAARLIGVARRGVAALPAPYLDAHAHSTSAALMAYRASSGGPPSQESPVDGAALARRLDADGIRRAFVLSTAYQMAADAYGTRTSEEAERARVEAENDFTAAECARFPDRIIPFLSVNPKRGYAVDEIDRCVEKKMRGLKLHLWNSLVDTRQPADLAALRRVVERAAHHRLPVVAHIFVGAVSNYGPDDTERFVREIIAPFDSLKISIAHLAGAGGFGTQQQSCFERLIKVCGPDTVYAARVWADMAATITQTTHPGDVRELGAMLQRWGLDRTLWGSDNLDGALELTRDRWPLDPVSWRVIADQRALSFIGEA